MTIKAIYDGARIVPVDAHALDGFKARLKPGQPVAVTVARWGEARSNQQQRLLHALIGRYARGNFLAMPVVKMTWKVDLGWWLPADKILTGDLDMPKWPGQWVDLHELYPSLHAPHTIAFVRSEASYTKLMEQSFIDYALECCAGSGVDIEDIRRQLSEL